MLSLAIGRCSNLHPPDKVRTLYINPLHLTICSVLVHYRESHCGTTYLSVVYYT